MSRFPQVSLKDCVEILEKLFGEIQRSEVDPETASRALGYSGENGAARSKLAALKAYGLIERIKGMVAVSELGVSIAHPLNDSRERALRASATLPPLFQEIWRNHRHCSEQVLASTLVHKGFDTNAARAAAKIFKANVGFAALNEEATEMEVMSHESEEERQIDEKGLPSGKQPSTPLRKESPDDPMPERVLASYRIPLGENEAELRFTGERLVPEDFDALVDYVGIFKRQFERKLKAARSAVEKSDENAVPEASDDEF